MFNVKCLMKDSAHSASSFAEGRVAQLIFKSQFFVLTFLCIVL